MLGVLPTREAIFLAADRSLDLIEVSPNAQPPVCRIMDYGKFKYESQKRQIEAKKKQKQVLLKEIKLGVNIQDHDLNVKLNHCKKFIEEGHRVKFSLQLRGRESMYKNIALELFNRIIENIVQYAKVQEQPKFVENNIFLIATPH